MTSIPATSIPATSRWAGQASVVYLPEERLVCVLLPSATGHALARVRADLQVGFVPGDPTAPPTLIYAAVQSGGPATDVRELLGASLAAAVNEGVAGPQRVHWVTLTNEEITALAAAWAPYRSQVLDALNKSPSPEDSASPWRAVAGRWARGWWTLLGGPLQPALSRAAEGSATGWSQPGADRPDSPLWGDVWLPEQVATAAGVHPRLTWRVDRTDPAPVVHLRAQPTPTTQPDPAAAVQVSQDDPAAAWVPLRGDASGLLAAAVPLAPGNPSALRLRTVPAGGDASCP